jgi:exonuclease VII small subunit
MSEAVERETGPANEKTGLFMENLANLKRQVQRMATQQEVDVDEVLPIYDSGIRSYRICKERVDLVKKMLAERSGESGGGES